MKKNKWQWSSGRRCNQCVRKMKKKPCAVEVKIQRVRWIFINILKFNIKVKDNFLVHLRNAEPFKNQEIVALIRKDRCGKIQLITEYKYIIKVFNQFM